MHDHDITRGSSMILVKAYFSVEITMDYPHNTGSPKVDSLTSAPSMPIAIISCCLRLVVPFSYYIGDPQYNPSNSNTNTHCPH